jgi:NAD-dependent SIR2 family protein deacetylase
MTGKQAASVLIGKKHFAIVTGAGISAASGIPTFRGDNGFWTRSYGGVSDPMKVLTEKFFRSNPKLVWEWHYDFIELIEKCKPNSSHYALNRFIEFCKVQKHECCMIT